MDAKCISMCTCLSGEHAPRFGGDRIIRFMASHTFKQDKVVASGLLKTDIPIEMLVADRDLITSHLNLLLG